MEAYERLAKILRTDKDFLSKVDERFSLVTGKKNAMNDVVEKNEVLVGKALSFLGVKRVSNSGEIFRALITKIEEDDKKIFEALGRPVCSSGDDCQKIIDLAKRVSGERQGFFLKKEKAEEFLKNEPPRKVMEYLGYGSVDKMLAKENLLDVYSALRFIEGSDWLNGVFFKQYERLGPDDFEERDVELRALGKNWASAADSFVKKKWHNISHLKELGVVFVLPVALGIPGEVLRMLSLIFHYLNEVPFYSGMFKKSAEDSGDFSSEVVSLLRGDVLESRMPEGDKSLWLVVQRYLAKDDENDWRLRVPHINPEALHWTRAERDLVGVGKELGGLERDLTFWSELGWVGGYFRDKEGDDKLVSFDLVDTVMSLVMRKELIKYLYHHEEALWNRIFVEYFGEEGLEKYCKDYLLQGYFEV